MSEEILNRNILSKMGHKFEEITDQIIQSQDFMSTMVDNALAKLQHFGDELLTLKRENSSLKKALSDSVSFTKTLEQRLQTLESSIINQEKSSLANNVIITGVPVVPDEVLPKVVEKTLSSFRCNVQVDSILSCERFKSSVSTKNKPPIRVVLKNVATKTKILEDKRKYGRLHVNELKIDAPNVQSEQVHVSVRSELTPMINGLLQELRSKQKQLNIAYVWPALDGNILLKKTSKCKPIVIRSRSDLKNIPMH